ncbi:MAG: hypothetical protein NZ703_14700, partial [Gemmataceae bacterium]|nr:hypothetical protein [Gemmataceae bacterium]
MAIETFHEAGPPLQWATADAHAFQKILLQQGYMPDQCLVWSGHRTTWAALMSQMRRLTPQWHDVTQLLILWIDRVFTHQGRTWLACTDTLRDDPIGTALPWAEVASWIDKIAPAATTVWLCDFSPLPLDSADCSPGWNEAELAAAATPKRIIMTAAAGQEESLTSASLQHGLWRYHLLEALRGHSREALDAKGRLTAHGLHQYMAQAVPRTLRKTHEGRPQQTPLCFGLSSPDAPRGTDVILAEFAPHSHPSFDWFDPARLKRVVFRSEQ